MTTAHFGILFCGPVHRGRILQGSEREREVISRSPTFLSRLRPKSGRQCPSFEERESVGCQSAKCPHESTVRFSCRFGQASVSLASLDPSLFDIRRKPFRFRENSISSDCSEGKVAEGGATLSLSRRSPGHSDPCQLEKGSQNRDTLSEEGGTIPPLTRESNANVLHFFPPT